MPPDTLKLRPLRHARLVDDVYRSLEEAILSGQLRPGEHLVETRIAEELAISRTTVREALLKLEHQGYVSSKPRRGTFVSRLSHEEALDLCYNRALLESFAVGAGYGRINGAVIEVLRGCIAAMRQCRLPSDVPQLIQIDLAFHRPLVEAAQSRRLSELWASLNGRIGALVLRSLESQQANSDDVVAFHERLLEAITSGDVALAQQGIIAHYVRSDERDAVRNRLIAQVVDTLGPSYQHDFQPSL